MLFKSPCVAEKVGKAVAGVKTAYRLEEILVHHESDKGSRGKKRKNKELKELNNKKSNESINNRPLSKDGKQTANK